MFFFVQKTNSTSETFGVGTLIATPSNFPFKLGIISPIDFNHNPASAIVDGSLTNVVEDNMGKISAWYDNEWGFSNRMCDIAEFIHQNS